MNGIETFAEAVGVDVDKLPNKLVSTILNAILEACGGDPSTLPNGLYTTVLEAIAEKLEGGFTPALEAWEGGNY